MRNPKRRAVWHLTKNNVEAYLHVRSLQSGYKERIHKEKPKFLVASKRQSVPKPLHEIQPRMPVDLLKLFEIRVGDLVKVRFGQDKGKTGIVLEVDARLNQIIVEGCGIKDKVKNPHATKPGERTIVYCETPIHVTNVAPVDPVTKQETHIKLRRMLTGQFVRLSSVSGSAMPDPVPISRYQDDIFYYKSKILKKMESLKPLNATTQLLRKEVFTNGALSVLASRLAHSRFKPNYNSLRQPGVATNVT